MKIREITVGIEETINVGNYESIKSPISVTSQLDEGDDLNQCHAQLLDQVSALWARQVLKELTWVKQRRTDKDKRFEFEQISEGLKGQLVTLVKGS